MKFPKIKGLPKTKRLRKLKIPKGVKSFGQTNAVARKMKKAEKRFVQRVRR